ncbi:hypothetical protein C1N91_01345 [Curtobacterium sp. SGAir0471]|uniref:hypothetical protein n=1 Tax=Curtobacterium sp. SGAir0471 TaxID=2070337 RepID=UPI0010CCB727|nr:hypothetical protein [Curtobacterium sp. SGAir0471]QCR42385.1 hypothetical protein C1N91_01345 [Curtobacterium sp. SGAir0471]
MTGEHGTEATNGSALADDDRIDAAGWWQLVALTVGGAVAPAVFFVLEPRPVPWVAVVVLGLALAVVLPAAQVWSWSRRGGRAAVVATRRWVDEGRVPPEVPETVWRPRVRQWATDARRRRSSGWMFLCLVPLWTVIATTGNGGDWGVVVVWAVLGVATLVQGRGDRVGAEQLLATPARPTV